MLKAVRAWAQSLASRKNDKTRISLIKFVEMNATLRPMGAQTNHDHFTQNGEKPMRKFHALLVALSFVSIAQAKVWYQ